MKKIFKLCSLVFICIFGVNSVEALQNDYYMSNYITFPTDISSKTGKLVVGSSNSDNKIYYQWQSISKENYDKILELQLKYEEDIKTYMKNKSAKADEVVSNCGFEKEAVMNWCGVGGCGMNSGVELEYNEEEVSEQCKKSLDEYSSRFAYRPADEPKYPKYSSYLPDIDETKWIETTNNTFNVSNDLSNYQVLYVKETSMDDFSGTLDSSYSFNLYDLNKNSSDMKGNATIMEENDAYTKSDIDVPVTINKKDPVVKEETKTETTVKEDKTTEKNPKTGIEKISLSVLILGLTSVVSYIIIMRKKIFIK